MILDFYGPQVRRNRAPSPPAPALLSNVVNSSGSTQTMVVVPGHREFDEFSIGQHDDDNEEEDDEFDPSSQAQECDEDEDELVTPSRSTRPSKASNSLEC